MALDRWSCSTCGETKTEVVDVRPTLEGVRRRRRCAHCNRRFTTVELFDPPEVLRDLEKSIRLFRKRIQEEDFHLGGFLRVLKKLRQST